MATLKFKMEYHLELDKAEFLLVSKALRGGATLTASEKQDCIELQEKLMRQRHIILEQMANEAAKTIANIENKKDVDK